jgi:hypothetical protein
MISWFGSTEVFEHGIVTPGPQQSNVTSSGIAASMPESEGSSLESSSFGPVAGTAEPLDYVVVSPISSSSILWSMVISFGT